MQHNIGNEPFRATRYVQRIVTHWQQAPRLPRSFVVDGRVRAVHRGTSGTTKSGKVRAVPLFDSVLAVIKSMKLARGTSALLWPSNQRMLLGRRQDNKPMSQSVVRKAFKGAAARAGFPKELRVHDLRHTFASLFLVDGGDIFKLSRILGHHSVVVTERTYAHLKPTAYAEDYGRIRFAMPGEAKVIAIR